MIRRVLAIVLPLLALSACADLYNDWFGEVRGTRISVPDLPDEPKPLDCKQACKVGEETADCVFINATVSRPEYHDRIQAFRGLFRDYADDGRIPHDVLMTLFDSQTDICNRGGVALGQDGLFTNASASGEPCYLAYRSNFLGELMLDVPAQITGRISDTDDGFDIAFPDPEDSLEILFGDADLHRDLGGRIEEVNVTNNRALVRTQTVCLASAI